MAEMIERQVTFDVLPDKAGQFEKLFVEEYRPAMASMPGYVKAELLSEQADPLKLKMIIRFESAESAAAWRESELHRALSPRLKALYKASQLMVYVVVA